MKFKVGDRVNYCCTNGTKYPGEITTIIPSGTGNHYTAMLDDGCYAYDGENKFEFETPQCPVVAMGYGATVASVRLTIGTKVTMRPTIDPNSVGSEYAGSVGTIIDTPSLFADTYEIEMGAAFNFQHVYATDQQFEVYQEINQFTSTREQWKKEGLCPQCGEKGQFSHFAFCCSKHGEY